jgi:hypothetical protein
MFLSHFATFMKPYFSVLYKSCPLLQKIGRNVDIEAHDLEAHDCARVNHWLHTSESLGTLDNGTNDGAA